MIFDHPYNAESARFAAVGFGLGREHRSADSASGRCRRIDWSSVFLPGTDRQIRDRRWRHVAVGGSPLGLFWFSARWLAAGVCQLGPDNAAPGSSGVWASPTVPVMRARLA